MFKCNVSAQLGGFNRADLLIKLTTNEAGTWWADYLGLSFSSLYCNLNKHVGTSDTTIKSVPLPFAIKTGQEISVVTICKGNEITVYVEDIETMRYTMSSAEQAIFAAATRVGLRHVKSSNFTIQATWDDIVVEKL
ncbi:hypothetical protein D3C72_1142660 [compost metagenome]